MKKIKVKKLIFLMILGIVAGIIFTSCSKKSEEKKNTETSIEHDLEETFNNKEVKDPVTQKEEKQKETVAKVVQKTNDELITEVLLEHYQKSFNQNNPIKSVGYLMYVVDDEMPGIKKAYGFATYKEYKIDNDKVIFDCGSGATPIALTFSTDGTVKNVDYEVLTDSDLKSEEFKKAFPKDVQERILKRDQADIDEVYKKQKAMVKKQYKEITGKELTTIGGEVMQDFTIDFIDGKKFTLSETNKPVFINFFATWCGPCMGEMPDLKELHEQYKNEVDFVFIDCGEDVETVKEFQKNGFETLPIAIDKDDSLSKREKVMGIPTTYILDKNKNIIHRQVGAISKTDYETYIKKALEK